MSASDSSYASTLRSEFGLHRQFLFGLCYRMTGSAADAEDLVQDTFERALRNPPADSARSLRPWLARVAVNLSCDQLRRRKAVPYRGTWLPEPVPTESLIDPAPQQAHAGARYELLESATYAFLLALEVLSPSQRAVLLLRDVFDYSVRETEVALELSEANVKTTLHRARQAMAGYDAERCLPTPALRKKTERALQRFMLHLATDNVRGIEALLREDVVALNDAGEKFVAARKPVVGRDKVAFFHRKLTRFAEIMDPHLRFAVCELNGLPALLFEYEPQRTDIGPRDVMRVELDARGKIKQIHTILAPPKLARVPFEGLRELPPLVRLTARGVRGALMRMQPKSQHISPHLQVHSGSRVRRKPSDA
jgi:RNA polymerase sigma-70 factor (ECF subfamily)